MGPSPPQHLAVEAIAPMESAPDLNNKAHVVTV